MAAACSRWHHLQDEVTGSPGEPLDFEIAQPLWP